MNVIYCTLYLPNYRSDFFNYIVNNYKINITVISDQTENNNLKLNHSNDVDFILNEIKINKYKIPFFHKNIYLNHSFIKVLFQSYDVYIMPNRMTLINVWVSLVIAKVLRKKIWLWGHGRGSEKTSFGKFLRKLFMKLSYGCLFYDYKTTEEWKEKLPNKLMLTVPNTLDNKKIENNFKNKFGKSIDEFLYNEKKIKNVIIFVGRLVKQKEPEILILAINELIKRDIETYCYFIGEGEMREKMELMIDKYNLKDYVKIIGELYEEENLSSYFSKAKLTVIPSFAGLSINHSLCYGVPVVIGDNFKIHGPEANIIQDGVNGFIFKDKDYIGLANIIYEYLNNEKLQLKMSMSARETIKSKYNVDNMANSLISSFYK